MLQTARISGYILAVLALFGAMSTPFPATAQATKRVALVIGNAVYKNVPPLQTPPNDAALIAKQLKALGFTLINGGALTNLNKTQFDAAVQSFSSAVRGADVALFYYAGHGIESNDTNYLVPTDANPQKEGDLPFQMVAAQNVLGEMEGQGVRLRIVILDACRNNPFSDRELRAISGGLSPMKTARGTLVSFATAPGGTAQEGAVDSPFTKALAEQIMRPGLDIFRTFNEVNLAVDQATNGAQQPWTSNTGIQGDFYFVQAQQAPTQQDSASAHLARGIALFHAENNADAATEFKQVIALTPGNALAHAYLARSLYKVDASLATSEARTALSLDAKQAGPHIALGNIALGRSDYKGAETEFRAALAVADDPVAHGNLGLVLIDQGNYSGAVPELQRAIALDPLQYNSYGNLGRTYYLQGKLDAATTVLRKGIAIAPKSGYVHRVLGDVYRKQHNLDGAAAEYRTDVALEPALADPHSSLGDLNYDRGNYADAATEYQRAIALSPKLSAPHNGLGNIRYAQDAYDQAAKEYATAAALSPTWATPHNNLGLAYIMQNKLDQAATEYRAAISLDPKFADVHDNLGDVYRRQNKLDDAAAEYQQAINLDPKNAVAIDDLGVIYLDRNRLDDAAAAFRQAITLDAKDAFPHNHLGNVFYSKKTYGDAATEYHSAIALDPTYASPHNNLGLVYVAQQKSDLAIAEFRAAINLDPKFADPHRHLAQALRAQGDTAGAALEDQRAKALTPP
jgi:tetratricopeptide (TPR) repeat protein